MGFCKATPSESSALISVSRIKAQQRENPQKENRRKYGLKFKKNGSIIACQDAILITRPYSQLKSIDSANNSESESVHNWLSDVKPIYLYQTYKPKPFSIIQLNDVNNQLHTKYRER